MLKIFFRSIAILTFAASTLLASPAYAGWVTKNAQTSFTLMSVDFTADGRKGLAVGTSGVFAMTFDGGRIWAPVSLPMFTNDLREVVFMPGTTTAVAVGNNGTILKFTLNVDGSGYSIDNLSVGGTDTINSVSFGDSQNGWMVTNGARIYRTTNGGTTWTLQINPAAQPMQRVHAIGGPTRAWAVGANGTILFTSNGTDWTAKNSGSTTMLYDIAFVNSTLWAVGNNNTILNSIDNGTNWHALASLPVGVATNYFRVRAGDANNVYVAGTKGEFVYSSDGGNNWHDFSEPGKNYFYGLVYINPTLQIGVGNSGAVLLYDSGKPSAPTNLVVNPSGAIINNGTPTVSWNASGDAETSVTSYEFRVGTSGSFTDIGSVLTKTISPALPDGTSTIYVRAKDEGGNVSDLLVANIVVDVAVPNIGAIAPASATTGVAVNYSVVANDSNGIANCHLLVNSSDRGVMSYDPATQKFNLSYTLFTAGIYTFVAQCTDSVGNKTTGANTLVTASGAPVAPPVAGPADSGANGSSSGGSGSSGGTTGGSSGSNPTSGNFVPSQPTSGIAPGTLIKLQCPNNASANNPCRAVYFVGADNKRHAFPNDKAYFTWYADWSGVQTVSAEILAGFGLGKNIVYRPGVKMIKFITDPKVYAVGKSGALRWVSSEAKAKELYGTSWAKKIDDVNDAFVGDYFYGANIDGAVGFNPEAESAAVQNVLQN